MKLRGIGGMGGRREGGGEGGNKAQGGRMDIKHGTKLCYALVNVALKPNFEHINCHYLSSAYDAI